uniref:Sushi domain-containing protein n=1 Tax=Bubo bubo TaxID=30461 RepID=A0A8C0ES66_BUBBB
MGPPCCLQHPQPHLSAPVSLSMFDIGWMQAVHHLWGNYFQACPYSNQTVFPVGRTVEYVCRPGYAQHLGMPPAITCLRNHTWSAALEFCKSMSCKYKLVGGSQRTCEVSGTHVSWSGDAPVCQRIVCDPPPDVPHGRHSGHLMDTFSYADAVTYTCEPGYSLAGEPSIFCTTADGEHGVWSGPPPRCGAIVTDIYSKELMELTLAFESRIFRIFFLVLSISLICLSFSFAEVTCPPPPGIANGNHSGQPSDSHLPGSAVQYSCRDGYSLIGNASISCTAEGTWSRPRPRCEGLGASCSSFPANGCKRPAIENGRTTGLETTYRLGDLIVFECDFGYALKGSQESHCQFGGAWDPPVPVCEKSNESTKRQWKLTTLRGCLTLQWVFVVPALHHLRFFPLLVVLQCPSPPNIKNGHHESKDVKVFIPGMSVKYYCDWGYVLTGKTTVSCLTSGAWSIPYPRCEVLPARAGAVLIWAALCMHPSCMLSHSYPFSSCFSSLFSAAMPLTSKY